MTLLLSITASILALYGVCVTYLLWVWYGEYQQLQKKCERLRWDVISYERQASDRLVKLQAANDEVEQLKEGLAKWQNRAGRAEILIDQLEIMIDQMRAVVK
jgi:chromosome segregation ATPase